MPKKVHFGDFFKTWSLRQKLVGNVKIQISNATILVIFKHCVFAIKFHFLQCQFRILAPFRYDFYTFWSFWSQEIFLQKSTKEKVMQQSPTQCLKVPKSLIFNFASESSFLGAFQILGAKNSNETIFNILAPLKVVS